MYSQKKLHIHFNCHKCGQITEYSDRHIFKELIAQRDYLEKTYGDSIEDITIVMTGICNHCKGKK
jgi:Fe2+ or Zn2+ uptake regulation protein